MLVPISCSTSWITPVGGGYPTSSARLLISHAGSRVHARRVHRNPGSCRPRTHQAASSLVHAPTVAGARVFMRLVRGPGPRGRPGLLCGRAASSASAVITAMWSGFTADLGLARGLNAPRGDCLATRAELGLLTKMPAPGPGLSDTSSFHAGRAVKAVPGREGGGDMLGLRGAVVTKSYRASPSRSG